MSRKYLTLVVCFSVLLILSLLLSACGGGTPAPAEEPTGVSALPTTGEAPPSEEAVPAQEGEIPENIATVAFFQDIPALDPGYMLTSDHVIGFQVYETLTIWDPDKGVMPKLATSWEPNEDGTEWTFHLRQGVKFHDGTPFTADAVKFSYERTVQLGLMAYYFAALEGIEVVDDYTIRIKLDAPRPMPMVLSAGYGMFIVNPNTGDKPSEWYAEGHDAGTGPYRMESYEAGSRLVLTRFPDYWGGWKEGQFTKVVYNVVEDPTVRQQMIQSGEADFTMFLPYEVHDAIEASGEVAVVVAPVFSNYFYQFHLDKPPMDNLSLRQALTYSFPYEAAQQLAFGGRATIAEGLAPRGLWDPPGDMVRPGYDLDEARTLLEGAGLGEGMELSLAYTVGDENQERLGLLWQAELAKLGIELKLQGVTNPSWWENVYNPDNEFDIMSIIWAGGYRSAHEFMILYHSLDTFTPYVAYSNADYDTLIYDALAAEAKDLAEANRLYAQANQMLYDAAVGVFALDTPSDFEYRTGIEGFKPNPVFWDMHLWYDMSRK